MVCDDSVISHISAFGSVLGSIHMSVKCECAACDFVKVSFYTFHIRCRRDYTIMTLCGWLLCVVIECECVYIFHLHVCHSHLTVLLWCQQFLYIVVNTLFFSISLQRVKTLWHQTRQIRWNLPHLLCSLFHKYIFSFAHFHTVCVPQLNRLF